MDAISAPYVYFCRLYGSYEALEGGSTAEALEDFTGGLIEHYDLGECPKEALLALMIRAFQMGSMFGCSIDVSTYYYFCKFSFAKHIYNGAWSVHFIVST